SFAWVVGDCAFPWPAWEMLTGLGKLPGPSEYFPGRPGNWAGRPPSPRRHQRSHLRMRAEPHVTSEADVVEQLPQDEEPGAVPDHVRVHRELEQPTLGAGRVVLVAPDLEDRAWWGVGTRAGEAVHREVRRVVADPLDRDLDDAGVL